MKDDGTLFSAQDTTQTHIKLTEKTQTPGSLGVLGTSLESKYESFLANELPEKRHFSFFLRVLPHRPEFDFYLEILIPQNLGGLPVCFSILCANKPSQRYCQNMHFRRSDFCLLTTNLCIQCNLLLLEGLKVT